MAVIELAVPTKNIKNCSFAVVGNPPTGQSTTDFRTLETICEDSVANTNAIISIFNNRLDSRFETQFLIIDGGGAY